MTRPAETITAAIGVLLGAVQILVGAFSDGFDFGDLNDPEVTGAITTLVGFVASIVTWYIARRQRSGQIGSGTDGSVQPLET